ncbi:MAG: hypothetical protein LBH13_00590 [Cellulomonadaceae bacterium]|jgi:hypothetical protein|nr:hypothetical protein [Cellulomonadaceae bacterium]
MNTPSIASVSASLGKAPLPAAGPDLAARVTTAIQGLLRGNVQGLNNVKATVTPNGAAIQSVAADLTGVTVGGLQTVGTAQPWAPTPGTETQAVIPTVTAVANPITFDGVPVTAKINLTNVGATFGESADGNCGVVLKSPGASQPLHGTIAVTAPAEKVAETVRAEMQAALKPTGIEITAFAATCTTKDPHTLAVAIKATLKESILSGEVDGATTVTVANGSQFTVGQVTLSSPNPLINAIVSVATPLISEYAGKTFDAAQYLPSGVVIGDVALQGGSTLGATITLK